MIQRDLLRIHSALIPLECYQVNPTRWRSQARLRINRRDHIIISFNLRTSGKPPELESVNGKQKPKLTFSACFQHDSDQEAVGNKKKKNLGNFWIKNKIINVLVVFQLYLDQIPNAKSPGSQCRFWSREQSSQLLALLYAWIIYLVAVNESICQKCLKCKFWYFLGY